MNIAQMVPERNGSILHPLCPALMLANEEKKRVETRDRRAVICPADSQASTKEQQGQPQSQTGKGDPPRPQSAAPLRLLCHAGAF